MPKEVTVNIRHPETGYVPPRETAQEQKPLPNTLGFTSDNRPAKAAARFNGFRVEELPDKHSTMGETVFEDESARIEKGKTHEAALATCVACVPFDGNSPAALVHFSTSPGVAFDPKPFDNVSDVITPDKSYLIIHGTQGIRGSQAPFIDSLKSWLVREKHIPADRIRVHESDRYRGLVERGDETSVVALASKEGGVRLEYHEGGGLLTKVVAVERIRPAFR